jgi:membrane-associated phospholipid phosphatase
VQFVTDFADQAVVLPLAFAIGAMLAVFGWPRAALAWVVAIGAAFGLTLAAKLVLLPCGPRVFGMAMRTPSGHTAAAAAVYGGLAALLLPGRWRYRGAFAISALVATPIAVTRLALGVHTGAEVAAGAAIGIASTMLLVVLAGERPPDALSRPAIVRLLLSAGVLALLLHGWHLPAEIVIRRLAFSWRLIGNCARQPA